MDKTTQKLVLAGLCIAGYFIYKKSQAQTVPDPIPYIPTAPNPTGSNYPIIYNKYHPDAKLLQAVLGVAQDGILGPISWAAWSKLYGGEIHKGYEIANRTELDEWIKELTEIKNGIGKIKSIYY